MSQTVDFAAMSDELREANGASDAAYEVSRAAWDEYLRLNRAYRSLICRFMDELNGSTLQLDRGLLTCGHPCPSAGKDVQPRIGLFHCAVCKGWMEKA